MAISLADLLQKDFPPENHLVGSGLLDYNSILIMGGPPKTYKSFLLNTFVLQLASGIPLLNASRKDKHSRVVPAFAVQKPCKVLLLEQEVGEMDMKTRFQQALGTFSEAQQALCAQNLYVHSCDHSLRLDQEAGAIILAKLIEQVKPDVVAFDPLKEFHYADENSSKDMSAVFGTIDRLRERFRFASIITHHTTKPQKDGVRDGPDLLRGSGYLFGKGDSFIMLRRYGRRNGSIQAEIVIRRGAPIPGLFLQLNQHTLLMEFTKWKTGPEREDDEEVTIS
jgi:hypothetical protein